MIFYVAGVKPTTPTNKWEDPRVAAEMDLNTMITFWEWKEKKKLNKKKRKFLKGLAKRKKRYDK